MIRPAPKTVVVRSGTILGSIRFRASGKDRDQQENINDSLQHRTNHTERAKRPHPAFPVSVLKHPMLEHSLSDRHNDTKNESETEAQNRPKGTTARLSPFGQDDDAGYDTDNESR